VAAVVKLLHNAKQLGSENAWPEGRTAISCSISFSSSSNSSCSCSELLTASSPASGQQTAVTCAAGLRCKIL